MLAQALTATPWGINALPVNVEVDCHRGLPQTQIVGLPDTAIKESRERVRTAIRNCGFDLRPRSIVVNLAPADLRKEGNQLDLAIALALLSAYGHLGEDCLQGRMVCGELGLDGSIRPVRGALALAELARSLDVKELILPEESAEQAAHLGYLPVIGCRSLNDALDHLLERKPLAVNVPDYSPNGHQRSTVPDLSEVRGQLLARRALEVAAAGGHNLLFIGPPGSGKTMLARRMPGILPPLALAEAVAVTKIHSLASLAPTDRLVSDRPFRSPHASISTAGLIGGGSVPRPGEVSLAHAGVLFLDELPEFKRDTLEAMRQPLEDGEISIVRAKARLSFPARFTLVASMNPCPCGHLGDPRHECRCSVPEILRYRNRISGPLLDRIDLHVEMPAVSLKDLRDTPGEGTEPVAERVHSVREIQKNRFLEGDPLPVNASLGPEATRQYCQPDPAGQKLLNNAFEKLGLSARALMRCLRVARTIADLDGCSEVGSRHLSEAIQYRSLDHRIDREP